MSTTQANTVQLRCTKPAPKKSSKAYYKPAQTSTAEITAAERHCTEPALQKSPKPSFAPAQKSTAEITRTGRHCYVWQARGWGGSGIELARVLVDAGADVNACADVGPLVAPNIFSGEGPGANAWTPLDWVQRESPRMRCGWPSRSTRAAHARRKIHHAEMISFLQECRDGMVREKAEDEEKQFGSMC
jgi:hypothetical protein